MLLPPDQAPNLDDELGLPLPIPPPAPIEENIDQDEIVPANQNPAGSGAGPSGVAAGRVTKAKTGCLKSLSSEQLECLRKYINRDKFTQEIVDEFMKQDGNKMGRKQIDNAWRTLRFKEGSKSRSKNIWFDAEIEIIKKWKEKPENERDHIQCTRELIDLGIEDRKYRPDKIKIHVNGTAFLKASGLYTKEFRNELNELYVIFPGNWKRVATHLGVPSDGVKLKHFYHKQSTNEKVPTEWTTDEMSTLNSQLQAEEAKG